MFQKRFFPVVFAFFVYQVATGQVTAGKNEVGVNAGVLFYQGDLAPDLAGSYKTARPAVGIYYNRVLTPYWSARLNLFFGGLAGDDSQNERPAYMRRRNFQFTSPVFEVSALGTFDFFGNNDNTNVLHFSPYAFAGAGVSFLNIKRDWSRIDSSMIHTGSSTLAGLLRDSATVLPKAIPVIPVGLGVKYAVTPRIAIAAEAKYRFLFTDFLDGFSYAANPERKDGYYSLTIGAVYNFGNGARGGRLRSGKSSVACPKVF